MITTALAGCFGNDQQQAPDDGDDLPEPTSNQDDWVVYYVSSLSDLPACNSDTLSRLYFVESDAGFQVCATAGWTFVDFTGPDGAMGPSGADGVNGTDGADGVNGTDGADGVNGTETLKMSAWGTHLFRMNQEGPSYSQEISSYLFLGSTRYIFSQPSL